MEHYELLSYSLCSKKSKKHIKSLNLKVWRLTFSIFESQIKFYINFRFKSIFQSVFDVYGCTDVTEWIRDEREVKRKFPSFKLNSWVHHICEVLHHPRIDQFTFIPRDIDDEFIEYTQNAVKGLHISWITILGHSSGDFAKKVLKSFPYYDQLEFARVPFDSVSLMNKYLVQNLFEVCVSQAQKLKIDQILISNSERILLLYTVFIEKDFNRFMKLWIRGSNPRLNYFVTTGLPQHGSVSLNENDILKGIKRNQIPLDSEEVYKDCVYNGYDETKLAGGYRIRRFDGATAVFVITECKFEFIVE
ncbi:unnamed protein product [Caenorhabditis brenneri]